MLRLTAMLDDPSPAAEAELAEWIARDPAHGVAFARAEAAWEASARLAQGVKRGGSGSTDDPVRPGKTIAPAASASSQADYSEGTGSESTMKDIARGTG